MLAEPEVLNRLEWDRVLEMIAALVTTPMGHEQTMLLVPQVDPEAILRSHNRVAEMRVARQRIGRMPIDAVEHPEAVLEALQIEGRILTGRDIYETVRLLSMARSVARTLSTLDTTDFPELAALAMEFPELSGVIDAIDGNLTPAGLVEDTASPELARIRREIRNLEERATSVLEGLLKAEWTGPVLRDRFVTVRNNRFVLPVRVDTPRRLPGIVHGHSASRQTVFVEPMETVEINNSLVQLREEEGLEIERILTVYTALLRGRMEDVGGAAAKLGEVDRLEAVAAWAEGRRAVQPDFSHGGGFKLSGARHPVLETTLSAMVPPAQIVPLDIDLAREVGGLVISGPNAGGKTVALKTIGLLTLMGHAGLPIPADEARMPFFAQVFADIGDEQSIAESLSTFASHVKILAAMLRVARAPALALIDEIGAGTDPAEGAALGIAVLERLRSHSVHIVATTHHAAIKAWAYRAPGVINAACDFDENSLRPTYKLVSGVAGASIGLTMARQLGLDASIVDDAERRLDPSGAAATALLDSVRSLASDLERQRAELVDLRRRLEEEARQRLAKLRQDEERRREEWRERTEKLVRSFRADADRVLNQLDDLRQRRALEKERARHERELRARYSEEQTAAPRIEPPPADWTPAEGEKVYVVSIGKQGIVRAIKGRRVEVKLGQATFSVPVDDLRPAATGTPAGGLPEPPQPAPPLTLRRQAPPGVAAEIVERDVLPELHLLGMRVDEGLAALDRYLDDALLAGYREVRIIHGFGTGRLKKAVREFLDQHPEVDGWRDGAPDEGGGGATVARLAAGDGS